MSAPNGVPRNARNQELRLFGAKHREIAKTTTGSIRDHIEWTKYFDPHKERFVSKSLHFTDTEGKRHNQYQTLIKQGVIEPPSAHFYDAETQRFVHHTSVVANGASLAKYSKRHIKGRVIYGADHDVTVRCILFTVMEDDDGNPMKELRASKRADKTLAHAVDPDGFYHQEVKEFVFTTSESVLKPYLPIGKVWWVKASRFADYVDWAKQHADGNPLFQGVFYDKLEVFASGLTAFKFVSAVQHDPAEKFQRLTVPNRDDEECEHVYSPYTMAYSNKDAKSLEEWLLPEYSGEWGTDRMKRTAPIVDEIDVIGGCGYNIVQETFTDSFRSLRNFDKGIDKRTGVRAIGKYMEVKMTKRWLYENVFHEGEAFNPDNLALSALDLRLFFVKYRVCLYVFDITGRIDEEASYVLPIADINRHLRPATTYVLQHNQHLFLLREGVKSLTQMTLNKNSVLYKPLKPFERIEVDDEEAAKEPTQSYYIGNDDTPVLFIEEISDLPTLTLKIVKRDKEGSETLDKDGNKKYHDRVRVACPCSMWLVLSELLMKCKYEPKVSMAGGSITSLTLKIDGVVVSISPPDAPPDEKEPYIPTEELFRCYTKHDLNLKTLLRNKETISTYSSSLLKALIQGKVPTLFRSPMVFGDPCDDSDLMAHDMNKAYTSFLKQIKTVPVFNEFDEFEALVYEPYTEARQRLQRPVNVDVSDPLPADDTFSNCSDPSLPTSPQVVVAPFPSDGLLQTSIEPFFSAPPVVKAAFDVSDKTLMSIVRKFKQDKRSNNFIITELRTQLGVSQQRITPFLFSEQERNSFYLVQRIGTLFKEDPRMLLLDQDYNLLTFETWLIARDWDVCHTLGIIKPSKLVDVAVGKAIDALWADKLLPVALKKFLANKHVGLCGKRFNKKHDTLIFTDNSEATHYFEQLGGSECAHKFADIVGGRKLYFVERERQSPLKNGFFPIQHIIYDKQRLALYNRAVSIGLPIVSAKVDCLWFKGYDETLLMPKDNSAEGIGSWSILKSDGHPEKDVTNKSAWLKWDDLLPSLYNAPSVINVPIKNEWDFAEFKDVFDNGNNVLILANIPGAGKTHSLIEYCKPLGEKALFVCPYNALADDLNSKGVKAITLHNLLGLMGGDSDDKKKPFDISAVTHIVYDEVFCHPTYMLGNIRRFNRANALMPDGETERKFFAAGDNNQNSPIELLSLERLQRKQYYFDCVSTIFDTHITLEICKRVSTDKERADLVLIKDLVLHTNTPLIDIAKQFFKPITSIEQVKGMSVCYLNDTAIIVNNFCNAKEAAAMDPALVISNAGRKYWVGQTLRCRKRLQVNGERMHVNYVYTVEGTWANGLVLKSSTNEFYNVSFASLSDCFAYNYAHTCHSLQGMSVATGISLHDLMFYFVTREWFYTALTRSRNLSEIYYWDPSVILHELQVVQEGEIELKMEQKLAGYKAQDAKAGRIFSEEDYFDVDDFKALLKDQDYRCSVCADIVSLTWKKSSKDEKQFTLDRLENDLAHVKGNCVVSCLGCNRAKH